MIPLDIWLGGQFLGAPPLEVSVDKEVVDAATALPRARLAVEFGVPGGDPNATVHLSLNGALWSGTYALGIPYDATSYEVGADLVIRPWLLPRPDDASLPANLRLFSDFAVGLRVIGLEQPWWPDQLRPGLAGRAGLGLAFGSEKRQGQVALRYEAMIAGLGKTGTVDSAAQDMDWTWSPSGSRLWAELGFGFR